jgi:hypothetical protein
VQPVQPVLLEQQVQRVRPAEVQVLRQECRRLKQSIAPGELTELQVAFCSSNGSLRSEEVGCDHSYDRISDCIRVGWFTSFWAHFYSILKGDDLLHKHNKWGKTNANVIYTTLLR